MIKTQMLTALTRAVGANFESCELTHIDRQKIDVSKAIEQHQTYETCLSGLGARVISLPYDPAFPDGVFVEDPAIALDEVAIITRPGAESRRGETESIAAALSPFRELRWLRSPAALEGGDVLRIRKTLYAGISQRTNREGISQLEEITAPLGYHVTPVNVFGCLHLKTACSTLDAETILANRAWFDASVFRNFRIIDVPREESWAANVLRIGETVLIPASFVKTRELLENLGFKTQPIDISELQKAEAGLTCCSLLFRDLLFQSHAQPVDAFGRS